MSDSRRSNRFARRTLGSLLLSLVVGCSSAAQPARAPGPVVKAASSVPGEGDERANRRRPGSLEQSAVSDDSAASTAERPRPWLGVEMRGQAEDEPGVFIVQVLPNSPAQRSGLQPNDTLLLLDGAPVNAPDDVARTVATKTVGDTVRVAAVRNNRYLRLSLRLEAFPHPSGPERTSYVGKPAPALSDLTNPNATPPPTLQSLRGKPALLAFLGPSWNLCSPSFTLVKLWQRAHAARGLQLIMITPSDAAGAQKTASAVGLSDPVWADPTGVATRRYASTAACSFILVDSQGVVREVLVGIEPKDLERMNRALSTVE
jgi:hypothetical protein